MSLAAPDDESQFLVGGRLLDAYRARWLVFRRRAARDRYYGSACTQFARLNTDGSGFIASLEAGYPFAWPKFGPGFVIEPQGQILWQRYPSGTTMTALAMLRWATRRGRAGASGSGQMDHCDRERSGVAALSPGQSLA